MELSAADARRMAIAAQGLDRREPDLLGIARRLGVIQLDSVNVLARSHYLVTFARAGAFEPAALDRLSHDAPRSLFEYWGHEASLLPVELQPALRWRMARAKHDAWRHVRAMAKKRALCGKVLAAVAEAGPVRVGALALGAKAKKRGWWEWSDAKSVIEWLFWSGQVTAHSRKQFERLYDLPDRVLPSEIVAAPALDQAAAWRVLVERSARALGVATETDLADYYRLRNADARGAIATLVEDGTLVPATVEGWKKPAFVHRDAPAPRAVSARALLSPFDNLIWERDRTERMFGMRYRIEIYTPAPKRVYGYYVLPFLLGDELVARIDLKADRQAGALRVQAAHLEGKHTAKRVVGPLRAELRAMADWLGLEDVTFTKRGNLSRSLR
jgi:uncharacterized protein YcaQ